jgi:hypothetical protein
MMRPIRPIGCCLATYRKKNILSWLLVAHTCKLSYSGGRYQEDRSSKPTRANSSQRHYLEKKPITERANGVVQGVGPEFKKKKKKERKRKIFSQ